MAIKVLNKRYYAATEAVLTRADLFTAIDSRYEKITLKGAIVQEVFDAMNSSLNTIKGESVVNKANVTVKNFKLSRALKIYKLASISEDKQEAVLELLAEKKGFKKKLPQ